jgi:uncharacterized protein involved in cysteine biosynthesis
MFVLITLAVALIGWFLFKTVYRLINGLVVGYFVALLVERVERSLGLGEDAVEPSSWWREAIDAVQDAGFLLMVDAGLVLLAVVPGLGLLGAVLGLGLTGHRLGRSALDAPMSLRSWRLERKRRFYAEQRWTLVGLGLPLTILGPLPLIGPLLDVSAAVGAVLLFRELCPWESVSSPKPQPQETADPTVGGLS